MLSPFSRRSDGSLSDRYHDNEETRSHVKCGAWIAEREDERERERGTHTAGKKELAVTIIE